MSAYPRFDPPLAVSDALLRGRISRPVGELFLGWVAANFERRTDALLAYAGVRPRGDGERVMRAFGRAITPILRRKGMTRLPKSGGAVLLGSAVSIAADSGLLMARLLCKEASLSLTWKLCERRGDSWMLPVLVGFQGELDNFDPLQEGAVLARASARDDDESWWLRGYRHWKRGIIE